MSSDMEVVTDTIAPDTTAKSPTRLKARVVEGGGGASTGDK